MRPPSQRGHAGGADPSADVDKPLGTPSKLGSGSGVGVIELIQIPDGRATSLASKSTPAPKVEYGLPVVAPKEAQDALLGPRMPVRTKMVRRLLLALSSTRTTGLTGGAVPDRAALQRDVNPRHHKDVRVKVDPCMMHRKRFISDHDNGPGSRNRAPDAIW